VYNGLGVAWASSLLGFVALLMCASPFAFMRYGDWVRQKSQFYQFLQERKQLGFDADTDRESTEETRNEKEGYEKEIDA
jgi:hypothetical protein